MPYFGIPIRNGLPLGLGSVVGLASGVQPIPSPGTIDVLNSAGTSYTVPLIVPDSLGFEYVVTDTVLASNGTPYVV